MRLHIAIIYAFGMIGMQLTGIVTYSQSNDSVSQKGTRFRVEGYIKDLQSLKFERSVNQAIAGNLIHNRLNFHYRLGSKVSGALELRNRIFWGEEVKLTPDFTSLLGDSNELINLSATWLDHPGLVGYTNVDRFWGQYKGTNFEIRIGRQRINWGIGTVWNPNDIFNTYNFLDFDYEERPGRDAVRMDFKLGMMSNIELAFAVSHNAKERVIAFKYFFNKSNYDYQVVGGIFNESLTLGGGWSGSMGNTGFKGELQYFMPHKTEDGVFNLSAEADYLFSNGWYLNGGFLFNSHGYYRPLDDWQGISFKLSPMYLMPTKWNTVLTIRKQITPLFSGSITSIYSPGANFLIVLPNLQYNIATNVDFDLVLQSFFGEEQNEFSSISQQLFFRTRLSF